MSGDRPLMRAEAHVFEMIKRWERTVQSGNQFDCLVMTREGADDVCAFSGTHFKVKKVRYDSASKGYVVWFTIQELRRYIEWTMSRLAMKWNVDGSITTFDQLTIPNDYLGDETYEKSSGAF